MILCQSDFGDYPMLCCITTKIPIHPFDKRKTRKYVINSIDSQDARSRM